MFVRIAYWIEKLIHQAREKERAQERLAGNQQGADSKNFNPRHCLEAITQPQYWVVM